MSSNQDINVVITINLTPELLAGGSSTPSVVVSSTSSSPTTVTATPTPSTTIISPYGQTAANWSLTFQDEFDSWNTNHWNDEIWYEAGNATKNYTVENGALKIWPQKDADGKFFNRTIDTDGKFTQTYGYFEIEAKLPVGKGTWPAFWLFNHQDIHNADGSLTEVRPEIDIMEAYSGGAAPWSKLVNNVYHPTMYAITIWKSKTEQIAMKKVSTVDLSLTSHKYGCKWTKDGLTFYFDGDEVFTQATTNYQSPMYMMLDLWQGSAATFMDDTTPQGKDNSYEINYVRAWKAV